MTYNESEREQKSMAIKRVFSVSTTICLSCVVAASAQPAGYEVTVVTGNPSGYQSNQDSGDGVLSFRIDAQNPGNSTPYVGTQTFPMVNLLVNQAVPGNDFTGARIENYQFIVRVKDIASDLDVVVFDGEGNAIGNIDAGIVSVSIFPDFTDVTDPLNPMPLNQSGGNYVIDTIVGTTPYTITFATGLSLPPDPPAAGTIFPYSMTVTTVPEPSSSVLLLAFLAVARMKRIVVPSKTDQNRC